MHYADLVFKMLEQQSNAGLTGFDLAQIPEPIRSNLPLQRYVMEQQNSEGLWLLDAVRVFRPVQVPALLDSIGYPELMQDLSSIGYAATKSKFKQRCEQAAHAHQLNLFYAR